MSMTNTQVMSDEKTVFVGEANNIVLCYLVQVCGGRVEGAREKGRAFLYPFLEPYLPSPKCLIDQRCLKQKHSKTQGLNYLK